MTRFKLDLHDQFQDFTVTRQGSLVNVNYDDHEAACRIIFSQDGLFVLEVTRSDGTRRLIHAAGAANGDDRQLWVNGKIAAYSRVRQRNKEVDHAGSLAATIPAIVTQILVNLGDSVEPGDKLILLESMKMIIPIQAPSAGIIKAVHCQEGDSVQAGIQLIEIEDKGEE